MSIVLLSVKKIASHHLFLMFDCVTCTRHPIAARPSSSSVLQRYVPLVTALGLRGTGHHGHGKALAGMVMLKDTDPAAGDDEFVKQVQPKSTRACGRFCCVCVPVLCFVASPVLYLLLCCSGAMCLPRFDRYVFLFLSSLLCHELQPWRPTRRRRPARQSPSSSRAKLKEHAQCPPRLAIVREQQLAACTLT